MFTRRHTKTSFCNQKSHPLLLIEMLPSVVLVNTDNMQYIKLNSEGGATSEPQSIFRYSATQQRITGLHTLCHTRRWK